MKLFCKRGLSLLLTLVLFAGLLAAFLAGGFSCLRNAEPVVFT